MSTYQVTAQYKLRLPSNIESEQERESCRWEEEPHKKDEPEEEEAAGVQRSVYVSPAVLFFLIHCLHTFRATWVFLWVRKTLHTHYLILVTSARQKKTYDHSSFQSNLFPVSRFGVPPAGLSGFDHLISHILMLQETMSQLSSSFRGSERNWNCVSVWGEELTWLVTRLPLSLFPLLCSSQRETKVTFLYISDAQTGLPVLALALRWLWETSGS